MRLPSSPGHGAKSRPSASACSYWQKTLRTLVTSGGSKGPIVGRCSCQHSGFQQAPYGCREAEGPELVFRDPAQVIFIGDAGARLDAPPTPRLQRQAVVGEGMGDGLERLGGLPLPVQVRFEPGARAGLVVGTWKRPQRTPYAAGRLALKEHAASLVVGEQHYGFTLGQRLSRLGRRQFRNAALCKRQAAIADRAQQARRRVAGAYRRTQVHLRQIGRANV